MKRDLQLLLVAVVALLPPASARSSGTDVPRIDNPAKAPSSRVVQLNERWRIGGDTDAEGEVFGSISDLVVGGGGRVYVLDNQTVDVRVFSRDGVYERSFGGAGEGPGELRNPLGLVRMPDSRIGVYQYMPSRVSVFEADGTYASEFYFTPDPEHGFMQVNGLSCRGGSFVVRALDVRAGEERMEQVIRLMRFDAAGNFVCELATLVRRFDYANHVVRDDPTPFAVMAGDGRVYVSEGWTYEIGVHDSGCGPDRMIARDYEPLRRTRTQIEAIEEFYRRGGGTQGARIEISKVDRDVRWMEVDRHGRLWVLSSRGRVDLPADSLGVFDVYEPSGRLAEGVDVRGEGNPQTDRYILADEAFFVVTRVVAPLDGTPADLEPMGVICYRAPE